MSPRLIFISSAMPRLFSGRSWNHCARTAMIQVRLTMSATNSTTVMMKTLDMALFTPSPPHLRQLAPLEVRPPRMMLVRLLTMSRQRDQHEVGRDASCRRS